MAEITGLIQAIQRGDPNAQGALITQAYEELRKLARAKMATEPPGTLQPTALVHEAWLRIGDQSFQSRAHFFSAAAEAMRRILIDRARRKLAARRGANAEHVDADEIDIAAPIQKEDEFIAVHDALDALAEHDARKAELVKLRYFAGLTLEEAAEMLSISVPTAKRDWGYAKAWLYREMKQSTELVK